VLNSRQNPGMQTLPSAPRYPVAIILIDPDTLDLFPPISVHERDQMKEAFRVHGCQETILVRKGHGTLLHGFNEVRVCRELRIMPRRIEEIDLPEGANIRNWMIARQLQGDLSPCYASYLRGKRYWAEKQPHGGRRKEDRSSCHRGNLPEDR